MAVIVIVEAAAIITAITAVIQMMTAQILNVTLAQETAILHNCVMILLVGQSQMFSPSMTLTSRDVLIFASGDGSSCVHKLFMDGALCQTLWKTLS